MAKIYKKILMVCSVTTQKPWVRYLQAADVRYNLDCWLVQACLPGAIVTTITSFLVCCKCNRQHRWLDIAFTNMHADPVQVYQACMLVGTSLQNDMTAG